MKTFDLKATVREDLGKKSSQKLRKEDLIPAVIYSAGFNKAITVSNEDVRKLIFTPDIFLINISIDGDERTCILKEIQFHPVTDRILHIDFLEVFEDKPITIEVPVKLEGHAAGVKAGGKLYKYMRKIKVKGLYKDIPEQLIIDITKLALGSTLQIGDLHFDNLELMEVKDNVVAAVKIARISKTMDIDFGEHEEGEEGEEGEESEGGEAAEEASDEE